MNAVVLSQKSDDIDKRAPLKQNHVDVLFGHFKPKVLLLLEDTLLCLVVLDDQELFLAVLTSFVV